eukprot:MONOS_15828.1-p1 / transcript=MONOS_15828.1 / gene=MONOS_15828 / organism=Monocercomonoides_exilis_PA203 / gene_product=unspecified product / transcript_product=unspecified product / location=Mono_scaffold01368:56-1469(-) / protein_length=423 / sequence_SO=supercontig / SO=protein_coding / is_pseudo=false
MFWLSLESHIFALGTVVQLFSGVHNSSAELKEIMLEKQGYDAAFDIQAKSFLHLDDCVFVRNNEWNGHFLRNGGTCSLINTTLGVGNGQECGMIWSVVEMEGGDLSSLFVRNSEFEDVEFCGSGGSILREGAGGFECVQNCKFANITKKYCEIEEKQTGKERMMRMSKMEDCNVERSMNVLEGGIVSATEGSVNFFCNNCTFFQNERTDLKTKNTEQNETTQNQSYLNAEWNGCTAPCGGALYVHDNSSATLTVENSSFVKCNATSTRGGGIYAFSIAECTVKHCSFVECFYFSEKDFGGAGAEIEGMTVQVFVENCLFKDGWSENDGGGLGIWKSKTFNTKDCVLNCFFCNCSGNNEASTDGGGFFNWDASDKVVSRNCLFQGCHSDWRGGAVTKFGNDIHEDDNFTDSQIAFCYSTQSEGV